MDPDELFTIRVQYLADTDPFNCMSMFPIPSRAPTYSFIYTAPLATQLGSILRLLDAPQRVREKIHYFQFDFCISFFSSSSSSSFCLALEKWFHSCFE